MKSEEKGLKKFQGDPPVTRSFINMHNIFKLSLFFIFVRTIIKHQM